MVKKQKENIKDGKTKEPISNFWINVIVVSAFLFIFLMALNFPLVKEDIKLDLVHIDITLTGTPIIIESSYSGSLKKSRHYEFKAQEYEDVRFFVVNYDLCSPAILDELTKDTVIQIGILKKSVDKLQSISLKQTVETTNVQWNIIKVFDIAYFSAQEMVVYLAHENVEKNQSRSKEFLISFISYLGVIICLIATWYFIRKAKN